MFKHDLPIVNNSGSPTWSGLFSPRRRRSLIFGAAFVLLLLFMHISSSLPTSSWREYSYSAPLKAAAAPRLTLDSLLSESRPLVRYMNETSNDYDDEYVHQYTLGRGYEGQADIYTHVPTNQTVVIKTFWPTTRTERIPKVVTKRLRHEFNVTAKLWPVDITATIRRYNNNTKSQTAEDLTIHAIDAFYVPNNKTGVQPLAWRMVLPLYSTGSLDNVMNALAYLNLSTADIDFMYRPNYRAVFEGLARMHTTVDRGRNIHGFCHDDIKIDNLFLADENHNILLGDLGQTRGLKNKHHKTWTDCRLVDAHRAWKTYLVFLREASARNHGPSEFDDQLMARTTDWAREYWTWKTKKHTLPQNMLEPDTLDLEDEEGTLTEETGFWDMQPMGEIMFPVLKDGVITRVPLGRLEAIAKVEEVRKEYAVFHKAEKDGNLGTSRPWWWWNMPAAPVENKTVEVELKVILGAKLMGMTTVY